MILPQLPESFLRHRFLQTATLPPPPPAVYRAIDLGFQTFRATSSKYLKPPLDRPDSIFAQNKDQHHHQLRARSSTETLILTGASAFLSNTCV